LDFIISQRRLFTQGSWLMAAAFMPNGATPQHGARPMALRFSCGKCAWFP
jgi:hypothetical protein